MAILCNWHNLSPSTYTTSQWRRQHLLRGGTKLEIRSWGTHGGLQGWVQQRLDDFVTKAVLIERAVSR